VLRFILAVGAYFNLDNMGFNRVTRYFNGMRWVPKRSPSPKKQKEAIAEALKNQRKAAEQLATRQTKIASNLVNSLISILKFESSSSDDIEKWFQDVLKTPNPSDLVDEIIDDIFTNPQVTETSIRKFKDFVFEKYPQTRIFLYKIMNHSQNSIINSFFIPTDILTQEQITAMLDCTKRQEYLNEAKLEISKLNILGADDESLKTSLMSRIEKIKKDFYRNIDELLQLDEDYNDNGNSVILAEEDDDYKRIEIDAELREISPRLSSELLLFYALLKKQMKENPNDTKLIEELFKALTFKPEIKHTEGSFDMNQFLNSDLLFMIIQDLKKDHKKLLKPALVKAMDEFIRTNCNPHNILNFSDHIEIFFDTILQLDPKQAKNTALFILKTLIDAGSADEMNFKFSDNFFNKLIDLLDTGDKPTVDFFIDLINTFNEDKFSGFAYSYLTKMLLNAFNTETTSPLFTRIIKNKKVDFAKLMDFIYDKFLHLEIISENDLGKYLKFKEYKTKLTSYYSEHPSRIPRLHSLDPNGELSKWLNTFLEHK
jgi:hypothetical protein